MRSLSVKPSDKLYSLQEFRKKNEASSLIHPSCIDHSPFDRDLHWTTGGSMISPPRARVATKRSRANASQPANPCRPHLALSHVTGTMYCPETSRRLRRRPRRVNHASERRGGDGRGGVSPRPDRPVGRRRAASESHRRRRCYVRVLSLSGRRGPVLLRLVPFRPWNPRRRNADRPGSIRR